MIIHGIWAGLVALLGRALWASQRENDNLRRGVAETDNLREGFIASVSHEFRTPLSSLTASLEILSDELDRLTRAEVQELLNSLQLSARGLSTLVDNLLDSASIEAGHFSLSPRQIALNPLLGETITVLGPLLERRQQTLTISAPFRVPTLRVDPNRVRQVLINLLTNASKYSPLDSTIEIRVETRLQALWIGVADRGIGLPDEGAEALFGRFYRADREISGEQAGLGLGLSVVKAIIEGHGGKVGASTRAGGGAVFWVSLPL